MSRLSRASLLVLPFAILAAAAAHRGPASAPPVPPAATPASADPVPALAPLVRDVSPGIERVSAFSMVQRTTTRALSRPADDADAAADGPMMSYEVQVEGELSLAVTEVSGTSVLVRAALGALSFRMRSEGRDILPEEARLSVERSLARPVFIETSAAGAVQAYHMPAAMEPLARTILRSVVASTQPVLSGDARSSWDTVEGDVGGEHRAFYRRTGERAVAREKGEYLRVTSARGLVAPSTVGELAAAGKSMFTFDERGWVATMTGWETLAAESELLKQSAQTRVEVSLRHQRTARRPDLVGAFAAEREKLSRASAADNEMLAAAQREIDRKTAGGQRPKEVLERLRRLDPAASDARAKLMSQLAALVRLDGAAAGEVARAVRSGELDALSSGTVIGALADVPSVESQSALADIVSDSAVPEGLRADAAMALGTGEHPNERALDTLRSAADSEDRAVHAAGTLGLGAAARTLGDAGGGDVVSTLLARLEKATSSDERALLFEALGNSGDARLLPLAERALATADPAVRGAAVSALRFVPGEAADKLIALTLLSDPERAVRGAALAMLGFREAGVHVASLDQLLRSEQAKSLRVAAVGQLGRWRSVPSAAQLLSWVFENDPDSDVRAAAEAVLSG